MRPNRTSSAFATDMLGRGRQETNQHTDRLVVKSFRDHLRIFLVQKLDPALSELFLFVAAHARALFPRHSVCVVSLNVNETSFSSHGTCLIR